jgi:hypothetical protein
MPCLNELNRYAKKGEVLSKFQQASHHSYTLTACRMQNYTINGLSDRLFKIFVANFYIIFTGILVNKYKGEIKQGLEISRCSYGFQDYCSTNNSMAHILQ